MENTPNSFQIFCSKQLLLEIKIDQHSILRAIATIDGTIHTSESLWLDKDKYRFKILKTRASIYSELIITDNSNVYLIGNKANENGKIPVMQLLGSGDTCGWAPPKKSRNNSAAKAPKIPTEAISQILTQYSYNVRKSAYNRIELSHDNSPILSITIDEQPTLYLIPQNSLELIFQRFDQNCYIFKNNETDIEIHICILGRIIFQQIGTNIKETFTHQNIFELLNIQLFYFKFTDIYDLLFKRFVQNGYWNNTLKITNYNNCLFEFFNNQNRLVLKLKIIYNPQNKEYKYCVILGMRDDDFYRFIEDKNLNIYITNTHNDLHYKINLKTQQIFKINTSKNVKENGIFELKWSPENYYDWEDVSQNPEEEKIEWDTLVAAPNANFSSFHRNLKKKSKVSVNEQWNPFSGPAILNNNFFSNQLFYNDSSLEWIQDNNENFNKMPPLIPIDQKYTTIAPLNLISILQKSTEPIHAKNIIINPENISKLFKRFVFFKGIDPKSPFDKLFKMNSKGMPFLDIEFYGVPYRLTWNNSKKLIKINSNKNLNSKIENVTNQLNFLDKCKFINNIKYFTDFFLTFKESNNKIIYEDTTQQILLSSNNNNPYQSEQCTIQDIENKQGYLWYDTDNCEEIYFIVNYNDVYCYQNENWNKITEYPQKLIYFIKKYSRPNVVNQNSKKKFAKELVELLKKSKKNNNISQLAPINLDLLQSVKDLLRNLPKLSKKLNQPPLNITAQLSPNLFLIPYGETSIVVAKESDKLFPFPLLYHNGAYFCKLGELSLIIKIEGNNIIIELKNKDGRNVPINPKLIGNRQYTLEKNNPWESSWKPSSTKAVKYLNWEDCWKDNKIQITDNMYIEYDPQNDRYFLRGEILSSTGSSSKFLNEPMLKNGNILSTVINGIMIKYDIDKCKELDYNPFIKKINKNNKNNKNNQVNNELYTFLDLLKREKDILDLINKKNTNIVLIEGFIKNFDDSYKKLNKNNKKKYENDYTTFKSKIIEKIDIVIQKNKINKLSSNDANLPKWTPQPQRLPPKTRLNKIINGLSSLKNSVLKILRSPTSYSSIQ